MSVGGHLFSQNSEKVDSIVSLLQQTSSSNKQMELYKELGSLYLHNQHGKAFEYYYRMLHLAIENNDTTYMAYGHIGLCDVYSIIGEYKNAIESIRNALAFSKGDLAQLSFCYNRLGIEYYNLNQIDLSLKYTREAIKIDTHLNDSMGLAYDYYNMGICFNDGLEHDSALYYFNQSMNYTSNDSDIITAYNYDGLAHIKLNNKDYKGALQYYLKASLYFNHNQDQHQVALGEMSIADIYGHLQQKDSALYYAHRACDMSKEMNNLFLLKHSYAQLSEIYENFNMYSKALEYKKQEAAYTDSIDQRNKQSAIETFMIKDEFEKQHKLLEKESHVNRRLAHQQNFLVVFMAIIILLFAALIVAFVKMHKAHEKNLVLLKQLDEANAAKQRILSIISHDLRDSVGSIRNFTELIHHKLLDNKSIKSLMRSFIPMIDSTHDLLENLLLWAQSSRNQFNPKFELVNSSVLLDLSIEHLQHLADSKEIKLEKHSEYNLFYADKNMLLTVIRNLLANAIKFSPTHSTIILSCIEKEELLEFRVQDHGVGMSPEQIQKLMAGHFIEHTKGTQGEQGVGLGLSLCKSFIEKHEGTFQIESDGENGSTFIFTIPYHHQQIS